MFSQKKNINNYKYIIVKEKFDFLKKSDQYKTSSLTKFLFKKEGFTVFMDTESLPNDLAQNKCLALFTEVKDKSSMFTIKNIIELRDCNQNIIFTSKVGFSKEKKYDRAYYEAIREAFESIKSLKYSYQPIIKKAIVPVVIPKKEIKIVLKAKEVVKVVVNKLPILYAQSKENGFQLVNATPEIVFQILKTNLQNFYIIKDKNGILYKKNESWVAEYYNENQLVQEEYQIKF